MKCLYCNADLTFTKLGWTHANGAIYAMYCARCGYYSDHAAHVQRSYCPKCGSRKHWRDHHCATPSYARTHTPFTHSETEGVNRTEHD